MTNFENVADLIDEARKTNQRTAVMGVTTAADEFTYLWGAIQSGRFVCPGLSVAIVNHDHCLVSHNPVELSQIIDYLQEYGHDGTEFIMSAYTDTFHALFCVT